MQEQKGAFGISDATVVRQGRTNAKKDAII